jgi:hypothetical protein
MTTQIGTDHKELLRSPFDVIYCTLVSIAAGGCTSFDLEHFARLLLANTFNSEELAKIRDLAMNCLVRADYDEWVRNHGTYSNDLTEKLTKITTLTHALLERSSEERATNVVDDNSTAHDFGTMARKLVEFARRELRLET